MFQNISVRCSKAEGYSVSKQKYRMFKTIVSSISKQKTSVFQNRMIQVFRNRMIQVFRNRMIQVFQNKSIEYSKTVVQSGPKQKLYRVLQNRSLECSETVVQAQSLTKQQFKIDTEEHGVPKQNNIFVFQIRRHSKTEEGI